jgi:syntaxin 5
VPESRSAFHQATTEIATGIHRTTTTLAELTKLVRRQGLFDDPTDKINSLTVRLKDEISDLSGKCDSAQQYVENSRKQRGAGNQAANHNSNVVASLKTELMHATQGFKTALELRSTKMKDQNEKKVMLAGTSNLSPMHQMRNSKPLEDRSSRPGPNTPSALPLLSMPNPYSTHSPYASLPPADRSSTEGSRHNQQMEQQLMLIQPPSQSQYYEQRQEAVTEVERSIGTKTKLTH